MESTKLPQKTSQLPILKKKKRETGRERGKNAPAVFALAQKVNFSSFRNLELIKVTKTNMINYYFL